MHRSSAHTPSSPKYKIVKLFLSILSIIVLLVIAGFYFFGEKGLASDRYVVAILGDPLEVVMFDGETNHWTQIQIPADTHMTGVEGLGEYRLNALWDVAASQSTPSAVVMETLTHELGVPVSHYIAKKGDIWQKQSPSVIPIPSLFSFLTERNYETNVTAPEFIGLSRKRWGMKPESLTQFILSKGEGLSEKKELDGTTSESFDPVAFDQMTGDAFQDLQIRQEAYRIAVYNTTDRALLGTRAARIISKMGGNVVQVGNDSVAVVTCEISGTQAVLSSHTARVIADIFTCRKSVTSDNGQADIVVKIGANTP